MLSAVSLFVERTCPETVFIALDEPFAGGKAPATTLKVLYQGPEGVVVEIAGAAFTDTVGIRFGASPAPLRHASLSGEVNDVLRVRKAR